MGEKKEKVESRVRIADRQRIVTIRRSAVARLARWVLEREGAPPAEISIVLVEDGEISGLNRRWFGRTGPTDVMAFPQPSLPAPSGLPPLGDVVVSTETVARQAESWEGSVGGELLVCLIHGLLHLLGWRDDGVESRRAMEQRQRALAGRWKEKRGWSLIK